MVAEPEPERRSPSLPDPRQAEEEGMATSERSDAYPTLCCEVRTLDFEEDCSRIQQSIEVPGNEIARSSTPGAISISIPTVKHKT